LNVLVTGGAGFIGSHLVDSLVNDGFNVYVIDNLSNGKESNLNVKCHFVNGDILDAELLKQLPKFNAIYHLAAVGSVPRSVKNPDLTFAANVIGTKNVLDKARIDSSKVIFSSSSSVYGSNQEVPMVSKTWTSPLSPYAASKASGEALLRGYGNAFGFETVCFRFFNVYGPRQRPDSEYAAVIPKFFHAALLKLPVTIHGDGEQSRDFTYVHDVISILKLTLANTLNEIKSPINLAFGKPISINGLIAKIENVIGSPITSISEPPRKGDINNSSADPSELRSVFKDFSPTPIEVGLKSTFEAFHV
jgi:UDP-glucose 4-epimerase